FATVDSLNVCFVYINTCDIHARISHYYCGRESDISEADEGNSMISHFRISLRVDRQKGSSTSESESNSAKKILLPAWEIAVHTPSLWGILRRAFCRKA